MLHLFNHPLIEIKLTHMRNKNTPHHEFRKNLNEIASLMTYEILRNYETKALKVTTPLNIEFAGKTFNQDIVFVPILRAGLGMIDGLLNLIPEAKVGHIGLYRDEENNEIKSYFYKIPKVSKESSIFVVDPMLATGGSAIKAIEQLYQNGFTNIQLICLIGTNYGIEKIEKAFGKDFKIYLAALDEKLNEKNFIEPGLGDAGDRIFGTK
ncbi:uracil phosphoribosyltransferase [Mycoplasmopsis gallinarum]|uniref:Uracil phosphoribosyltransferase n=1 Tax=Mycoplasmopsis gallinarum TaxID=29557 RepID=A0A168R757_9BACT|nr:uracil phosphoribosyltransferase [Mycoplasmopsis gallinarum]OAB48667.1 Uracil phosphoribosyltransferase [Mycoplasmopsis gallinarum]